MRDLAETKSSPGGESLALLYGRCLGYLRLLAIELAKDTCPAVQRGFVDITHLTDERGRFKLWGEQSKANLPAKARGSLDDTLRGGGDTRALISSILSVFQVLVKEAIPLLQKTDDEEGDASDLESLSSAESTESEGESIGVPERVPRVTSLLQQASKQIDLLFEVSSLLTRSTMAGRWLRSTVKTDSALNEAFDRYDRLHVEEKIRSWRGQGTGTLAENEGVAPHTSHGEGSSDLPHWLSHRLGQANTRRRVQLQYWAEHPYGSPATRPSDRVEEAPLPSKEDAVLPTRSAQGGTDEASTVKPRTVTGSQQQSQPSLGTKQTFSTVAASDAVDGATEADRPRTIYTPSVGEQRQANRVPDAPRPGEDGKIFCPYCGMELQSQTVEVRQRWKRHVFRDLRPYVCTFEKCSTSEKLYLSRADWVYHEWQVHRRQFRCDECDIPFENRQDMADHLTSRHADILENNRQISLTVDLCERPADETSLQICAICEQEMSLISLQGHLATHMEDLALWVLRPDTTDGDVISNESQRVMFGGLPSAGSSATSIAFDDKQSGDPFDEGHQIARGHQSQKVSHLEYVFPPSHGITLLNNEFARGLFARPAWPKTPLVSRALARLCSQCLGFDLSDMNFSTTQKLEDIHKKSKECELCALFSEAAKSIPLESHDVFACRRDKSSLQLEPFGNRILSIYSQDEGDIGRNTQIGSPWLPEPGSAPQLALISEWLRVCQEMHNHMRALPRLGRLEDLPTRVLDVSLRHGDQIRLIDSSDMESTDYAVLSQSWGSDARPLSRSTIDLFRGGVNTEALPLNVRDAIIVARGLKVRYLWVDLLCVVQDSFDEVQSEVARLEVVFCNALVVIAATSAPSCNSGFLNPVRPERPQITVKSPSGALLHICKSIDNFQQDVEEGVLNKRGWTLQERVLARRTIHFTSTQAYMECEKGVQCETLTKLYMEKSAMLGDSNFPYSSFAVYRAGGIKLFQDLFRKYSTLHFTVLADRSVGISGLERRLMTVYGNKAAGYGIFEAHLERSLLWVRDSGNAFQPINYQRQPGPPSWSWMSYDGRITYLEPPMGAAMWTHEYSSPFRTDEDRRYWQADGVCPTPVFKCTAARKLSAMSIDSLILWGRIILDLPHPDLQVDALRCIVLGWTGKPDPTAENYILVIEPCPSKGQGAYVRVGAGAVRDHEIDWDSEEVLEVH